MWNSAPFLGTLSIWALWIAAISGGVAAVAALVGGLAAQRASEITTQEANSAIAEANARAEEAHAQAERARPESVRAAERLQKLQEVRRLSPKAAAAIARTLEHDFGNKEISVASVADTEARMFALEFMRLFEATGSLKWPGMNAPEEAIQTDPHPTGISLKYRIGEGADDEERFLRSHKVLSDAGIHVTLHREDDHPSKSSAYIFVLRKPNV